MAAGPKKAILLLLALAIIAGWNDSARAQVGFESSPPGEGAPPERGETEASEPAASPFDGESAATEVDEYGSPGDIDADVETTRVQVRYVLEGVQIEGNEKTRDRVIRSYVPFEEGDVIDPESEDLEIIELRLRGTGWFNSVRVSLRRGQARGRVIILIEVDERNTIVVEQVALGISEGVNDTRDQNGDLRAYGGFTVAETNLGGTGVRLAITALLSRNNQGVRLDVIDPTFVGSRYNFHVGTLYIDAREYFGVAPLVGTPCGPTAPITCAEEIDTKSAVVFYRRGGFDIGTGRHLNRVTRYSLDWQGDVLSARSIPEAASELRGTEVVPIDFHLEDEMSFVSAIRFSLVNDRRDDPAMPSQGTLLRVGVDAASRLVGSDYDYLRLEAGVTWWQPLPWGHTFSLHAFAGVIFGDAPFYLLYHISDFTDLIPSRILEIELDRRLAPNAFGTSIEFMRKEEVAMRFDVGYDLPLYRSRTRGLRRLNAYFNVGVYSLASLQDLRVAVPGYTGAARIPIDLTFDLGLRFDTRVGVFQVGFSNFLGFFAL